MPQSNKITSTHLVFRGGPREPDVVGINSNLDEADSK